MLYRLLPPLQARGFSSEVISLIAIGPMGPKIESLGVPVGTLGMRRGIPNPLAVLRLAARLRRTRPDVVQTWMYHANLVGGFAARLAGGIPTAWSIHHTTFEAGLTKPRTMLTARMGAWCSRSLPARIVCCSQATYDVHAREGYDAGRMMVIPNGFDTSKFAPDAEARKAVRRELGISDTAPLIGLIARFDPQKNHAGFMAAAALLHARIPDAHFLLCGDGVTWDNPALRGPVESAGLRPFFRLLGRRDDVPRLMAALDVATSSSTYGEAFPLIVGEAMACGVPCVVTDVGDSAALVGDTGVTVAPGDPNALAQGWLHLLRDTAPDARLRQGQAARARVQSLYGLDQIAERYANLYRGMVEPSAE